MANNIYYVYALINNDKPIYVGCTCNLERRMKQHKQKKKFSYYVIIEEFYSKAEALICERGIIKYISLQNDNVNINGKYNRFSELILYKSLYKRNYGI